MSAEDELAIRALVARYADAVCRRDPDAWAATWAQDCRWDLGGGRVVSGRAETLNLWRTAIAKYDWVGQVVTSGLVEVDGDRASGWWYIIEFNQRAQGDGTLHLGHYDAFREVLEVNFFGPLRLVRAFAPSLRRPRSGVIFVLSVSAVALSRSAPIYSASKAACLMLALGLREELREGGGTVTVVIPGFIDTGMGAAFASAPKASPVQIAERSLDGWLAGHPTVWPDPFAELVRDTVGEPFQALLDRPREIMTDLRATIEGSTAPGPSDAAPAGGMMEAIDDGQA